MAIEYKFYLDELEIEEPVGFSQALELSLKRDDNLHGMQFEASTSTLQFYAEAFDYLHDRKETELLQADVIFKALYRCDPLSEFELLIQGRLNFGRYNEDCGTLCLISLPLESDTCEVTFKNRYDQKVDIDKQKGYDGQTVLPDYAMINVPKTMQAKHLLVGTIGYVKLGGYSFDTSIIPLSTNPTFYVRPIYERAILNSIDDGQVDVVSSEYGAEGAFDIAVSPQLLFADNESCFSGPFHATFRLKGSYNLNAPNVSIQTVQLIIIESEDITSSNDTDIIRFQYDLLHDAETAVGSFDQTFSDDFTVRPGFGLYALFGFASVGLGSGVEGNITWHEDTGIDITANKACPATEVKASMVHELLSRAVESVTNYCMRVKSQYYGRTDSQPFSFEKDGCGGLRWLTSGLKIRRAEQDNFFVSPKELIEGLQAIDNIGMGIEADPDIPGKFLLRLETLEYFYNEEELFFHDNIPQAASEVQENKFYSKILIGYDKWEVQKINGLDEINSNREYHTGLTSVSNTLDMTSNLVAGSYALETTRQQTFADTGRADTSYDNETFIITAERNGVYSIEFEQGNITDPSNIYSPETTYNYNLSPLRNLMRWYRSIINSYASVSDSDSKLFFSSGTANLKASGAVPPNAIDHDCIIENQIIYENQDLWISQFAKATGYTPLYKNEIITYEYPMSITEYHKVKANPYGYIRYQCGKNGKIQKGYVQEIKYRHGQGKATFILKKKYGS